MNKRLHSRRSIVPSVLPVAGRLNWVSAWSLLSPRLTALLIENERVVYMRTSLRAGIVTSIYSMLLSRRSIVPYVLPVAGRLNWVSAWLLLSPRLTVLLIERVVYMRTSLRAGIVTSIYRILLSRRSIVPYVLPVAGRLNWVSAWLLLSPRLTVLLIERVVYMRTSLRAGIVTSIYRILLSRRSIVPYVLPVAGRLSWWVPSWELLLSPRLTVLLIERVVYMRTSLRAGIVISIYRILLSRRSIVPYVLPVAGRLSWWVPSWELLLSPTRLLIIIPLIIVLVNSIILLYTASSVIWYGIGIISRFILISNLFQRFYLRYIHCWWWQSPPLRILLKQASILFNELWWVPPSLISY